MIYGFGLIVIGICKGGFMNGKLQKVAKMIKKTFHSKDQNDCFDGCVLYMEEYYSSMRVECMGNIESKFIDIKGVLETMSGDVKAIKEDLGLNGKH